MLRVLAYASFPSVIGLIFIIPQIIFNRNGAVEGEANLIGGSLSNIFSYGSLLIEVVLWGFTIIFTVVGVSEVQKFSFAKTILNLLLPLIFFLIPVLTVIILQQLF